MATHAIAAGERGAYEKTLTADTVDTVTFAAQLLDRIEVVSDGDAAIFFTVDGTAPTVGGAATYHLPAIPSARELSVEDYEVDAVAVKLISSGTPTYSVARA